MGSEMCIRDRILITVSGVLFLPLAFYALKGLLDSVYAYHIAVGPWTFVTTLGIMLLLAIITIGSQVYRIATANPIQAIRTE